MGQSVVECRPPRPQVSDPKPVFSVTVLLSQGVGSMWGGFCIWCGRPARQVATGECAVCQLPTGLTVAEELEGTRMPTGLWPRPSMLADTQASQRPVYGV